MNPEDLISLAETSIREQRADEAAGYCLQVLGSDPGNRNALHLLALARNLDNRTAEALELLEQVINSSPKFAPAYNDYGAILLGANRPKRALAALRQAIELQPKFADAYVNLGNAQHKLGNYAEAESNYRRGVELDPGHARGWISLGNLLRTMREFEEAVRCFEAALELQPTNPLIHNFLGVGYRNLGKKDRALAEFRHALELDPDLPEANVNYGGVLMGQKSFRDAIPYLEKGRSDRSIGNAAECLLQIGAYDELFNRINELANHEQVNLFVAAISAYMAERLGRPDPYPFCPDPLEFVKIEAEPGGRPSGNDFLQELIRQCSEMESFWEPIGVTTRKGFQTPMSLFQAPSGALVKLSRLIEAEVASYREQFQDKQATLIRNWPDETALRGWFVRLVREGHQRAHNHTDAWLSGCFYLKIPETVGSDEGAIEFCLDGPRYPEIGNNRKSFLHKPKAGELALFPSSLFHRTIPFNNDDERLCIAFDIVPGQ